MMKTVLTFPFVLVLAVGCSLIGVYGPEFQDADRPFPRSDEALVYVYRVGRGPDVKIGSVNISVDGEHVFGVKNRGYSFFYLRPGTHLFKAEWPSLEKPLFEEGHFDPKALHVAMEGGRTYFINYLVHKDTNPVTFTEASSLIGKAFSKSHVISADLCLENETVGFSNLQGCKLQSNNLR
jgi:hypothetical protein